MMSVPATSQEEGAPGASLSLDLDNLWCYQRSFGLEAWQDYPSFLELAVPRILDVLTRLDLRLTVFIIGRDTERTELRPLLAEAVGRGHEAGNHSFDHDPEMHNWPRERQREEIVRAGQAIEAVTGQRPRGFRGPAYATGETLLQTLVDLGYDYDASNYSNSLASLARAYHRRQSASAGEGAAVAGSSFAGFGGLRGRLGPYCLPLDGGSLVEVPVTTLPILRLPIHGTYLNALASYSPGLAMSYFRAALRLCRLRGVPPSFLLHATDFLGGDDVPGFDYLPGMRRPGSEKVAFMTEVLRVYRQYFSVQPVGEFVDGFRTSHRLRQSPAARLS